MPKISRFQLARTPDEFRQKGLQETHSSNRQNHSDEKPWRNLIYFRGKVNFTVSKRTLLFFNSNTTSIKSVGIARNGETFLDLTKEDIRTQLDDRLRQQYFNLRKYNRSRWRCGINMFSSIIKIRINNKDTTVDSILNDIKQLHPDIEKMSTVLGVLKSGDNVSPFRAYEPIYIKIVPEKDKKFIDLTKEQIETQLEIKLLEKDITLSSTEIAEQAQVFFDQIKIDATEKLAQDLKKQQDLKDQQDGRQFRLEVL